MTDWLPFDRRGAAGTGDGNDPAGWVNPLKAKQKILKPVSNVNDNDMLPCCCATEEYIGASIDAGCGNGAKLWYAKKILKGFDGTDN